MSEFKHIETIDAYLEGRMDESEKRAFEQALQDDATLRAEFDACQAANKAAELMAFQGMMERVRQTHGPAEFPTTTRRPWWLFALIALAGCALFWLYSKNKEKENTPTQQVAPIDSTTLKTNNREKPENNKEPVAEQEPSQTHPDNARPQLIAEAKSLYEPVSFTTTRGSEPIPLNATIKPAGVAFDNAQYQKVLTLTAAFKKDDPDYWLSRKMAAHAYFQLGQYDKAAAIFAALVNQNGKPDEQLEGYLLLSWLAAGKSDTPVFKALLQKIQKNAWHPFHDKSLKIKL